MVGRYEEARGDMRLARAGFADLRLYLMAAYLALLVALAELLAGDPVAAERAVRDAEAMVSGPGDRLYQVMVNVDLAATVIAQDRPADAAAVIERIDAVPAPCDLEWSVKRHIARAHVASRAGDLAAGLEEAEAAVALAEPTPLLLVRADAQRTLAAVLRAAGRTDDAAAAARRALALDERKGNLVAAAATRRLLEEAPALPTYQLPLTPALKGVTNPPGGSDVAITQDGGDRRRPRGHGACHHRRTRGGCR